VAAENPGQFDGFLNNLKEKSNKRNHLVEINFAMDEVRAKDELFG
jgi:hypothetical protein